MGFFQTKEEEVVLCSPMEGVITLNGEPVKGAKLERIIKWKDEAGKNDFITTDEQGRFSFPALKEIAELNALTQFSVSQKIDVHYKSEIYRIWTIGKLDKKIYAELDGRPLNFSCELTDDFQRIESSGGILGTLCKWDSIQKT